MGTSPWLGAVLDVLSKFQHVPFATKFTFLNCRLKVTRQIMVKNPASTISAVEWFSVTFKTIVIHLYLHIWHKFIHRNQRVSDDREFRETISNLLGQCLHFMILMKSSPRASPIKTTEGNRMFFCLWLITNHCVPTCSNQLFNSASNLQKDHQSNLPPIFQTHTNCYTREYRNEWAWTCKVSSLTVIAKACPLFSHTWLFQSVR